MFAHRTAPVLPRAAYCARVVRNAGLGVGMMTLALGIGMWGYHYCEHLSWLDAFAHAAMIVSGMGPLATPQIPAGIVFAGCYALFSGLGFIVLVGVVCAPTVHRFLHRFHLEAAGNDTQQGDEAVKA
jgi:hypothetical protein